MVANRRGWGHAGSCPKNRDTLQCRGEYSTNMMQPKGNQSCRAARQWAETVTIPILVSVQSREACIRCLPELPERPREKTISTHQRSDASRAINRAPQPFTANHASPDLPYNNQLVAVGNHTNRGVGIGLGVWRRKHRRGPKNNHGAPHKRLVHGKSEV